MSQDNYNRPTEDEAKLDTRDFLNFLFSGDANNKSQRAVATLEDIEELYQASI